MRYAGCMADSVRPPGDYRDRRPWGFLSFSLLWRRGRRDLGLRTYLGLGLGLRLLAGRRRLRLFWCDGVPKYARGRLT